MSPFFIKEFKKKFKCPVCPSQKQSNRSLCAYHLRVARERWSFWQKQRQQSGLCCYCHRKSFRGYIRCRIHTIYNRAQCKAWSAKFSQIRYNYRKRMGWCPASPNHSKPTNGHTYCDECITRLKARKRKH
jgi:hypothetical protein